jgi:hypothetical protein
LIIFVIFLLFYFFKSREKIKNENDLEIIKNENMLLKKILLSQPFIILPNKLNINNKETILDNNNLQFFNKIFEELEIPKNFEKIFLLSTDNKTKSISLTELSSENVKENLFNLLRIWNYSLIENFTDGLISSKIKNILVFFNYLSKINNRKNLVTKLTEIYEFYTKTISKLSEKFGYPIEIIELIILDKINIKKIKNKDIFIDGYKLNEKIITNIANTFYQEFEEGIISFENKKINLESKKII